MRRLSSFLLAALCLCLALPAMAQDSETTSPWIAASFSGGTYSMSKANEDIQNTGELAGLSYEEISDGLGYGVGVGLDVGRFFRMGLHFQRILADATSNATELNVGMEDASLEYDYPASAFYVAMAAMRPFTQRFGYGLELGVGVTVSAAELRLEGTGLQDTKTDLGGTGPFFVARAMFDTRITRMLELTTTAGYRYAATHEMAADGAPIRDNDNKPFSIDYSGFEGQFGLRFYFVGQ